MPSYLNLAGLPPPVTGATSGFRSPFASFLGLAGKVGTAPPTPPVVPDSGVRPSGGIPETLRVRHGRTREEVSKERSRYGITDKIAARLIEEVAARQAERLELDAQKRFEELERELELRRIGWDARYLEALNAERERLITQEIAALLRRKMRDDEEVLVLLMMAAAVA